MYTFDYRKDLKIIVPAYMYDTACATQSVPAVLYAGRDRRGIASQKNVGWHNHKEPLSAPRVYRMPAAMMYVYIEAYVLYPTLPCCPFHIQNVFKKSARHDFVVGKKATGAVFFFIPFQN